jgi:diadenosine tetraphosphate (Ap4A) HIT family hydrolase
MQAINQSWMPRPRWDALVRGEGCPACSEVTSDETQSADGYRVADLTFSRLRLAANQWVPGYSVLVCRRHVREPYELSRDEQMLFFEDFMRVGQAMERVFRPVKLNLEILGNLVPHLHCHVVPRYYGDPAPGRPIDPHGGRLELAPQEYEERVELIRSALSEA